MARKANTREVDHTLEIGRYLASIRTTFARIFNRMLRGDERIADMPISVSQLRTLSAFHEDRFYRMSELSRNALVTMPSMTEMVDKLESLKIMKRIRDKDDRRVVKVGLTSYGKKLHQDFITRRSAELSKLLGMLAQGDREELLDALKKVAAILEKIKV